MTQASRVRALADAILDKKGLNLVALDLRESSSFADVMLIATGSSDRHVRTLADAVVAASKALGERPLGVEGQEDGRWVLIDLNDVIVHLFLEEVREHYDLERLWSDAVRLQLGTEPSRNVAS